jgi:hypothetical protein
MVHLSCGGEDLNRELRSQAANDNVRDQARLSVCGSTVAAILSGPHPLAHLQEHGWAFSVCTSREREIAGRNTISVRLTHAQYEFCLGPDA